MREEWFWTKDFLKNQIEAGANRTENQDPAPVNDNDLEYIRQHVQQIDHERWEHLNTLMKS